MRPAIYGGEVVKRNDSVVGFNVGYNFFAEHEHGVLNLINALNKQYDKSITLKLNKKRYKDGFKMTEKYKNTPFSNCILRGNLSYIRKEIIVDNTELKKENKYNKYLLSDGEYTMFLIDAVDDGYFSKMYGQRRKFSEEELLYMKDYNYDMSCNFGFMKYGSSSQENFGGIVGAWSDTAFIILIPKHNFFEGINDIFENSLKTGSLAVCDGEAGLFRDRGLSFVFLDKLYPVDETKKKGWFRR